MEVRTYVGWLGLRSIRGRRVVRYTVQEPPAFHSVLYGGYGCLGCQYSIVVETGSVGVQERYGSCRGVHVSVSRVKVQRTILFQDVLGDLLELSSYGDPLNGFYLI